MNALLALILSTFHPHPVVLALQTDTGMGKCGMDDHFHTADGNCHRNSDDSIITILPKVPYVHL